jgi:hypothetical protein
MSEEAHLVAVAERKHLVELERRHALSVIAKLETQRTVRPRAADVGIACSSCREARRQLGAVSGR